MTTAPRTKAPTKAESDRSSLAAILPPGATVYTITRHTSASGFSHVIDPVIVRDGGAGSIAWYVAKITPFSLAPAYSGLRLSGAGMDMGFELVYHIGMSLYPNGFTCAGPKCPSNDHSNGDRDYSPHHHAEGGYALIHRCL